MSKIVFLPMVHTSQSVKFTVYVLIFSGNSNLSFNPLSVNPTKWWNTLKRFGFAKPLTKTRRKHFANVLVKTIINRFCRDNNKPDIILISKNKKLDHPRNALKTDLSVSLLSALEFKTQFWFYENHEIFQIFLTI